MRNRWDHEAPEGHQPVPADNTSRYIYAQVSRWLRTDEPIHPEVAMEIAAWWHGPGRLDTAVTYFSHSGTVKIHGIDGWDDGAGLGPDLGDAVRRIIMDRSRPQSDPRYGGRPDVDTLCLNALSAYVAAVEHEATRYRRNLWSGGDHRWMSTGTTDEDSCLTCGVVAVLRPEPGSDGAWGCYYGGDGELIISCTGRTDLVHGTERHCDGTDGRGCADWQASQGETCEHVDHECNCVACHG